MFSQQDIYNDLVSDTFEETSKSKKDIFIENIAYVKKLLLSGLSTKKQIEKYSKKIEKISRSCYESYSKEFLNEIYEEGLKKSLFIRNIKKIAYYLTNEKNPKSSDLYKTLIDNGSLKLAKNKKDSSLDYENFSKLLKEFLHSKGYEEIITFDCIKEKDTNKTIIPKSKEVEIVFLDNSSKSYDIEFLKNNFIEYEDSYIDNNIKEKNAYYIQTQDVNKEYDFEKFKEVIANNEVIENYSIILHNNSVVDTKLYIYRYIDNNLVLLKSINAKSSLFELEELIRRARNNFFEKLKAHMHYIQSES